MPKVVCVHVSSTSVYPSERNTHIYRQVQQVERARVRHVRVVPAVVPRPEHHPQRGRHHRRRRRHNLNAEPAARQHRHEDVGHVHQHAAKHLLGHVEEPDLDGPLRPLPPTLIDQGEERQRPERQLHKDGKRAQELAVAFLGGVVDGAHGDGGRRGGGGWGRGRRHGDGDAVGMGVEHGGPGGNVEIERRVDADAW